MCNLWPGIDWIEVANDMMENKMEDLDASEIIKVSTLKFVKDVQVLLAKTEPKVNCPILCQHQQQFNINKNNNNITNNNCFFRLLPII